jgi:hypothetical protein
MMNFVMIHQSLVVLGTNATLEKTKAFNINYYQAIETKNC